MSEADRRREFADPDAETPVTDDEQTEQTIYGLQAAVVLVFGELVAALHAAGVIDKSTFVAKLDDELGKLPATRHGDRVGRVLAQVCESADEIIRLGRLRRP